MQILRVGGPDKGPAVLVDHVAGLAGLAVHFNQAKALMPAIDLLVGEMPPVLLPAQEWKAKIDPLHVRLDLLARRNVEKVKLITVELVPGQRVGASMQLGPAPALG